MSSQTQAILDAIATLGQRLDAIESRASAPRASQRTKAPKDGRTLAERRAESVGGACRFHGKRFATRKGYDWHMANIAHN